MKPDIIERKQLHYAKDAKILGLTLSRNAYTKHIKDITNKAQIALTHLKDSNHSTPTLNSILL